MLSPLETGTAPGGNSGDVGGAGKPAPDAGAWPWRSAVGAGQTGKLASLVRRTEQGPLHLIHGGGLVSLCPSETPPHSFDTPVKVATQPAGPRGSGLRMAARARAAWAAGPGCPM